MTPGWLRPDLLWRLHWVGEGGKKVGAVLPESQEAKVELGARSVDKEDWLAGLPCSERLAGHRAPSASCSHQDGWPRAASSGEGQEHGL